MKPDKCTWKVLVDFFTGFDILFIIYQKVMFLLLFLRFKCVFSPFSTNSQFLAFGTGNMLN